MTEHAELAALRREVDTLKRDLDMLAVAMHHRIAMAKRRIENIEQQAAAA